ncbi:MAG TPA: LysE family translocator [Paucimonas sp.]|nr:LysE family translocator [Paucimonas sp.]
MTHAMTLWIFFLLVFSIIVLPGLDMAFVLASALGGGRRAGLSAVAGVILGGFCHFLMGALGLAVVLDAAPGAFNALLIAGALYVAWIGLSLARSGVGFGKLDVPGTAAPGRVLRQGVLTNLLNPKAYVFMLAVFPQFVRPAFGSIWMQTAILALICACTQAAVYGTLALAASRARTWFESNPARSVLIGRAVGGVLIAAALLTGVQGWRGA